MKSKILLLLIVFLGAFLRLYQLGEIPIELNRDEASLGYTAYSLYKTGKDEYGRNWPINVESFGDWKLPGYSIAAIPSVALFGLSAWSVRLPSALAGIFSILLVYILTSQISSKIDIDKHAGLLTAALLAISPWHIHFSRMAYEVNFGLFAMLIGVVSLFSFIQKSQWHWLILSAIGFGFSVITYHSYQVISLCLLLVLVVLYHQHLRPKKSKDWSMLIIFGTMILLPYVVLFFGGASGSNATKLSGITILDETTYYNRLFEKRQYFENQAGLFAKMYSNIPLEFIRQLLSNGFNTFTSNFLFIKGGGHGSHDIEGIGKIYSALMPLLLMGLLSFTQKKHSLFTSRGKRLLFLWLLIAMVPAIITWEPAHATRLFVSVIPLTLLSVSGAYYLHALLQNKVSRVVFVVVLVGILTFQFWTSQVTYFEIAPVRDSDHWHWYAKDMAYFLNSQKEVVESVYVHGTNWSPYIYYLFYNQIDPVVAQRELVHLPADDEGFRHVAQFENITFGEVPYQHLIEQQSSYAVFAPVSNLTATMFNNIDTYDEYRVLSRHNAKESYVEIVVR